MRTLNAYAILTMLFLTIFVALAWSLSNHTQELEPHKHTVFESVYISYPGLDAPPKRVVTMICLADSVEVIDGQHIRSPTSDAIFNRY